MIILLSFPRKFLKNESFYFANKSTGKIFSEYMNDANVKQGNCPDV